MTQLSDTRNVLIEEIGITIEHQLNISPLAARIYALLTLSSYDGISFDEIRDTVKASKSSVSVNINVLLQLKYITYYTKTGSRKRYFKVAKYFQLQALVVLHESLQKDLEMVEKINAFNKIHHPQKFKNDISFADITKDYIREEQALIEATISKMEAYRKIDTNY